jgi:hypothetical protein
MYESVPQYSSVSLEVDRSKAPRVEKVPFTVVAGVLPNENLVKASKEPICHSMFCFGVPPSAQNSNVVSGAVARKPILNFTKLQGSDIVVMLLAANILKPLSSRRLFGKIMPVMVFRLNASSTFIRVIPKPVRSAVPVQVTPFQNGLSTLVKYPLSLTPILSRPPLLQ